MENDSTIARKLPTEISAPEFFNQLVSGLREATQERVFYSPTSIAEAEFYVGETTFHCKIDNRDDIQITFSQLHEDSEDTNTIERCVLETIKKTSKNKMVH